MMNLASTTYTAVEAQHKFGQMLDEVQRAPVTITDRSSDIAVVLSMRKMQELSALLDDFFIEQVQDGKMTLLQALSNQATVRRDEMRAEQDYENGDYVVADENFTRYIQDKALSL